VVKEATTQPIKDSQAAKVVISLAILDLQDMLCLHLQSPKVHLQELFLGRRESSLDHQSLDHRATSVQSIRSRLADRRLAFCKPLAVLQAALRREGHR
jgi:hypothetical protein